MSPSLEKTSTGGTSLLSEDGPPFSIETAFRCPHCQDRIKFSIKSPGKKSLTVTISPPAPSPRQITSFELEMTNGEIAKHTKSVMRPVKFSEIPEDVKPTSTPTSKAGVRRECVETWCSRDARAFSSLCEIHAIPASPSVRTDRETGLPLREDGDVQRCWCGTPASFPSVLTPGYLCSGHAR